jgi:ethanolamine permease
VALFWNDDYRPGVVAVAIFYAIAVAYFALVGRNRLVLSPEEEFAMTRGVHGHPEREGYGVTERERFGPGARPAVPPPVAPETGPGEAS